VANRPSFPLQSWLGDAMAGPTPVSALIHAATMVTAGVYLVVRSHAIFDAAPNAQLAVVIVGAITLTYGAIVGCAKDDIKKALAASTMSQIGYMMLAAGLGPVGYAFAIFHLLTHGFFKAGMFLGAGSVMHGMNDKVDMRGFGNLSGVMKITWVTFGLGWLAILGVPPFAGFWSKDKIIEAAFVGEGWRPWVFGMATLIGAGITAFYMSRLFFMTFHGDKRWPKEAHPHESPRTMTVPMIVLAVGSAFLGLILGPTNGILHWLEPVVGGHGQEHHPVIPAIPLMGLTLLVVAGGVALAWMRYWRDAVPRTAPVGSLLTRAARQDLYQDQVNEGVLMRPGIHLTRALVFLDQRGVDGAAGGPGGPHRRDVVPPEEGPERPGPLLCPDDAARRRRHPWCRLGGAVMNQFPWLTVIGLIPLVGAVVLWLLPASLIDRAKHIALGASVVTLIFAVAGALQFSTASKDKFQLVEEHSWIPQFGVSYALGVDGIALSLILMSVILVPVCLLAAWNDLPAEEAHRERHYFALMLVLETFMVGVFAATDVFLFYVFFEAMLVPVYFLIGQFGGPRRQYAAVKFLLFSLAGGLIMLAAVIALYVQGPGGADGFLLTKLAGIQLAPGTEKWIFLGFFIAFAVKAPMVPVHTWLPDAAAESRPATATLLVGVLDKVGTYGMIRFCLELFPGASQWGHPGGSRPGPGVSALRGLASHRADRPHAAHRLHLDQPLRLHRAGHLRDDLHELGRVELLHDQPRVLDGWPVPRRRDADQPPREQANSGLRGLATSRPWPRRRVAHRRALRPGVAGPRVVRLGVPRPGRHLPALPGGRHHRDDRHHPGRALHLADVPAHHDRREARERGWHTRLEPA
jgi:NADH:ubiquinone oxidoreductase subunit 5 (subunit L)/multisubunit Na+/H+ antiporter MnhA subunit